MNDNIREFCDALSADEALFNAFTEKAEGLSGGELDEAILEFAAENGFELSEDDLSLSLSEGVEGVEETCICPKVGLGSDLSGYYGDEDTCRCHRFGIGLH